MCRLCDDIGEQCPHARDARAWADACMLAERACRRAFRPPSPDDLLTLASAKFAEENKSSQEREARAQKRADGLETLVCIGELRLRPPASAPPLFWSDLL